MITKLVNTPIESQTISFGCLGQLYGLEKFWAFLKYSHQKPKVNPKLEEILKNYKRLEDFRVAGASFPQQFYPTKSGIKVKSKLKVFSEFTDGLFFQTVSAPEAIAAAAAKNSEGSNSFKTSGEFFPARPRGQHNRRTISERC